MDYYCLYCSYYYEITHPLTHLLQIASATTYYYDYLLILYASRSLLVDQSNHSIRTSVSPGSSIAAMFTIVSFSLQNLFFYFSV